MRERRFAAGVDQKIALPKRDLGSHIAHTGVLIRRARHIVDELLAHFRIGDAVRQQRIQLGRVPRLRRGLLDHHARHRSHEIGELPLDGMQGRVVPDRRRLRLQLDRSEVDLGRVLCLALDVDFGIQRKPQRAVECLGVLKADDGVLGERGCDDRVERG